MAKLVRDKTDEIVKGKGDLRFFSETSDTASLVALLAEKVKEEADEVHEAVWMGDRTHLIEEIGDLSEVLHALAEELGISEQEIWDSASSKRMRRGGFNRGLVYDESIAIPDLTGFGIEN